MFLINVFQKKEHILICNDNDYDYDKIFKKIFKSVRLFPSVYINDACSNEESKEVFKDEYNKLCKNIDEEKFNAWINECRNFPHEEEYSRFKKKIKKLRFNPGELLQVSMVGIEAYKRILFFNSIM